MTKWVEAKANELLAANLAGVKRMDHAQALQAPTTHRHDYVSSYVADLENVIDFDVIRSAKLRLGVDPLGGAGCDTGRPLPSTTSWTWKW
ncbi:phosphoglucomutase [Pseudomonas putida]|nr:phosphoglucomutase [Pseudomonas putida]